MFYFTRAKKSGKSERVRLGSLVEMTWNDPKGLSRQTVHSLCIIKLNGLNPKRLMIDRRSNMPPAHSTIMPAAQ